MQSAAVAMRFADLHRVATVLERVAQDVLGHADVIDGVTIPVEAFGAGEAAWQLYEQRRQALVADLRSAHGRVTDSGSLVRTAVDAHDANDTCGGSLVAAILRT
jgi:hypothetical protein